MRPTVLLLDIDGTLVDNTRQHIDAWREAFDQLGFRTDDDTLRRNVGKGGDLYVKAVAGEDWDRQHGDEARKIHGDAYKRRLPQVRPVAGVHEFLAGLTSLQIRPVLGTSSGPDEVKANLRVIGETPDHFLVVDKDDIETSKPAPDVFGVALERSRVPAADAAAVGDTRWDAEAATRAKVTAYGVLTGGGTREELLAGGAEQVFDGLDALLTYLKNES
jgi:phosphoglycolate phosphatase-like HAD superfamily hydrolase